MSSIHLYTYTYQNLVNINLKESYIVNSMILFKSYFAHSCNVVAALTFDNKSLTLFNVSLFLVVILKLCIRYVIL